MRYFSIYVKLIVYFLLISVPPILIMGVLSFVEVTRIVRGETERVLSLIAHTTANQIGRAVDERLQDVLIWSTLSEVVASLEQGGQRKHGELVALLNRLVIAKGTYDILMVLDAEGRLVAVNQVGPQGQPLISRSVMDRDWKVASNEWFEPALSGETVLGPWHYDSQIELIYAHDRGSYSVILANPIRRKGSTRVLGLFVAYINWNEIQLQLEQVRQDTSSVYNVNLTLIAAEGRRIIGHRNSERFGQIFLDRTKLPADAFEEQRGTFGFSSPLPKTLGYATVALRYTPHGPGWLVCVDVLDREIFADTLSLRDTFMLLTCVVVIAIIGLVYFVSRMITRPLLSLVEDAAAVAKGDFNREITISSVDEIGVLQNAFHLMTGAIRQRDLKLQEMMHDLERANRLKSEFLANMSHELRTPMNSIIGFTSLTLERAGHLLPPRHQENLQRVKKNARNLLSLLNSILDLSKIESGSMDIYVEEFDAAEVIEAAVNMVNPLVQHESVRVEQHVAAGLPPLHQDQNKVKQILVNLLSNAAKFTAEGFIRVSAEPAEPPDGRPGRPEYNGPWLALSVADSGIGIDEQNMQAIFDEFWQVDAGPTRRYGGTGLGLSISLKLAVMLGGEVKASSVKGQGSTFTLILPQDLDRYRHAEDRPDLDRLIDSFLEESAVEENPDR